MVLYLHGGGYVAGSVASHRNLLGHLAQAIGCRIFAAEYSLAPEFQHPAPVKDSAAVYRSLVDQGYSPSRMAVAGDSAGGGLAMATLLALKDDKDPLPAAAALISPWVDAEGTGESMTTKASVDPMITPGSLKNIAALFLGPDGDPKDPLASPLLGDVAGLPPILIQVGESEVLLDDSSASGGQDHRGRRRGRARGVAGDGARVARLGRVRAGVGSGHRPHRRMAQAQAEHRQAPAQKQASSTSTLPSRSTTATSKRSSGTRRSCCDSQCRATVRIRCCLRQPTASAPEP